MAAASSLDNDRTCNLTYHMDHNSIRPTDQGEQTHVDAKLPQMMSCPVTSGVWSCTKDDMDLQTHKHQAFSNDHRSSCKK